ncbi:hypothetical protein, partial [Thermosynechococcus sp.]|uniref:hypothetical protein n=1 Tax=Thermosynechococcus sp. TaxID=2814275 RepID=UPI00391A83D0
EHKEMPPLYLSAQVNGEYDIRLNISRFYKGIAKMKGSLWLAISNKELYDGKHAIVVREMGNPDFLYMQVPLLA